MQTVNVSDIKVKDGVTKGGTRDGQPWELIIITGDDGSEFTTFDAAAKDVGIGGIIELEPVIKAGKTNFTKFNIIKKGAAPVASVPGDGDTPEKRLSIESQSRAERITELWIAAKIPDDDPLVTKLRSWLDKLETQEPAKAPGSSTAKSERTRTVAPPAEGEAWPPLKNRGELYTRASKFGLSPRDVLAAVKEVNPEITKEEEITDYDAAWKATATKFAGTIQAAVEAASK